MCRNIGAPHSLIADFFCVSGEVIANCAAYWPACRDVVEKRHEVADLDAFGGLHRVGRRAQRAVHVERVAVRLQHNLSLSVAVRTGSHGWHVRQCGDGRRVVFDVQLFPVGDSSESFRVSDAFGNAIGPTVLLTVVQ